MSNRSLIRKNNFIIKIRALKLRIANLEIQLAEKDIVISELRSDLAKERKKILENESFD